MNNMILDYEQMLIGNRLAINSFYFYGSKPGGANQTKALQCIRHVIENILCWTPEEAKQKFDLYMIHLMKLERMVDYIEYPDECEQRDPKYVLSLLYPNLIRMDEQDMIIQVYTRVLKDKGQFPREYFIGQKGFYRFSVCLCYVISHYHPFDNLDDMYHFFTSSAGNAFLDKKRLRIPLEHLNIDLLKGLYTITDEEPYSNLIYHYWEFTHNLKQAKKEEE